MIFFNSKLLYTPALELFEFNQHALVIDFETVGAAEFTEPIEVAVGNHVGEIVFESLVQPVFNPIPPPSKLKRFDRNELKQAPTWLDLWPEFSRLIENSLLIAFNAPFDRRTLAATCSRHHMTSNERGWRCAMRLITLRVGLKRSITLTEACALFGLEGGNHRAARDVTATIQLLNAVAHSI
jgi:DNA polymerase III epsilon subunit-like protein